MNTFRYDYPGGWNCFCPTATVGSNDVTVPTIDGSLLSSTTIDQPTFGQASGGSYVCGKRVELSDGTVVNVDDC